MNGEPNSDGESHFDAEADGGNPPRDEADPAEECRPNLFDQAAEEDSGGGEYPPWYDNSFHTAAWAAVPEIGATWRRWYDVPYRLLNWWIRSRWSKVLPRKLRDRSYEWLTALIRYNDHARNKVRSLDDPMHNIFVPVDEHLTVPALWLIELFPPSAAPELRSLVRKYNPRIRLFSDPAEAVSILSQTRAGQGYDWFALSYIQAPKSRSLIPDSRREQIPDVFEGIELTAIQLGTGLTAVVAQFRLTEESAASLDREWHAQHEPQLRRHRKHLIAEDREWSAYSQTQEVRRAPHDAARKWMARNCPGLFAQSDESQPLMDLLIIEKHDPAGDQRPSHELSNALRALGLTRLHTVIASPAVPEFVLIPTDLEVCPTLETSRTWALWGNHSKAIAARPGLTKYAGPDEFLALAHGVDEEMRDVFVALSVSEMVNLMQRRYTELRDSARQQHNSFSPRDLQHLRRTLLTLSIDVASTKDDVPTWWERHRTRVPPFYLFYPGDKDGEPRLECTEHLRSRQLDELSRLREADATIRDILSTVSALGAASDAFKLGRVALYVAIASSVVAIATLLFTTIGPGSVATYLWAWLQTLWSS